RSRHLVVAHHVDLTPAATAAPFAIPGIGPADTAHSTGPTREGDPVFDQIIYEVDDPVATITLNRPEALNAWTGTMSRELREAVRRAEADPAVVGIVVTGAGRGFCAGADLDVLSDLSAGGSGSD